MTFTSGTVQTVCAQSIMYVLHIEERVRVGQNRELIWEKGEERDGVELASQACCCPLDHPGTVIISLVFDQIYDSKGGQHVYKLNLKPHEIGLSTKSTNQASIRIDMLKRKGGRGK